MSDIKTYYIDTEVASPHDFKAGLSHYFKDAEVLLIQFAEDDKDPEVLIAADIKSKDQLPFFRTPCRWVIHNADFDVMALSHHLGFDCYDLPDVEVVDTSMIARQHRLPAALGDLAKLLGTANQKLAGTLLINRFCKPNKKGIIHPRSGKHWDDFVEYGKADITTLRDIYKKIGHLEYRRHKPTEIMNRNGIPIDQERAIESWKKTCELRDEIKKQLPDISRTAVYLKYLNENGVHVSNLQKQTLLDWLDVNPDHPAVELVELRLSAGKSVLNKYEIMAQTDRVTHSYLYYGASATARWSAKGLQPQNFPRPQKIDDDVNGVTRDIALLKNSLREHIRCDQPMTIADLKQIEPRLQAWLIGDVETLQFFRDEDAGLTKLDYYQTNAARMFGKPEVTKEERTIAKTCCLALSYGGGVDALQKADPYLADSYNGYHRIVFAYRKANWRAIKYQYRLNEAWKAVLAGKGSVSLDGRIRMYQEQVAGLSRIVIQLPNKSKRYIYIKDGEPFDYQKNYHIGVYGGKLYNMIIQSMGAEIVMEIMDRAPQPIIMATHDEIVWAKSIPKDLIKSVMCTAPDWLDGIPINTTIDYNNCYIKSD